MMVYEQPVYNERDNNIRNHDKDEHGNNAHQCMRHKYFETVHNNKNHDSTDYYNKIRLFDNTPELHHNKHRNGHHSRR